MVPPSPGGLALLVDFSPPRPITLIDADLIDAHASSRHLSFFSLPLPHYGGSVVEWSACWTRAQKGPGSNRSRDAVG